MKNSCIVSPAFTNFDRFGLAVNGRMEGEAPLAWERCRNKQKPILPRIPLTPTIKPLSNYWGFFVSAVPPASAANLNGLPERIHRLIGSPLIASLAALVNRLCNLPDPKRQNGLAGIELTRYAHLASIRIKMPVEQWSRAFILSCPLMNLWSDAMASWRDSARPKIAAVIREVGRDDIKALRKALRDAYPYGERKYHPYKIWCDEIHRQLGTKSKDTKSLDMFKENPDTLTGNLF